MIIDICHQYKDFQCATCDGFLTPPTTSKDSSMIKILHVDDEADIRSVTKLALESIGGFNVVSCASGREALESVVEVVPDLIVMDVMMPELDGPATLSELQKIPVAQSIPVIFMTAKTMQEEIEKEEEQMNSGEDSHSDSVKFEKIKIIRLQHDPSFISSLGHDIHPSPSKVK